MFSPLGLWEQLEKEEVALVDGFLASALRRAEVVVSERISKLLYFNRTVSFEIIC